MKSKFYIKNKISLIAIILIMSLSIIGVTYAYLMDNDNKMNVFTISNPDVKIVENFPQWIFTSENKTLTKEVSLVNEGTADMVVRISYNEFFYDTSHVSISTAEVYSIPDYSYAYSINTNYDNIGDIVRKNWVTDFSTLWVEKDGWYYYKKILKPLKTVDVLESVTLMGDYENHPYSELRYELNFNLEAVQATSKAVNDLWGKDVSIEGEDVTWAF